MIQLSNDLIKSSVLTLVGTMIIILCSLLAFKLPGSDIPQTAQTFGVLVVAAIVGPRLGFYTVLLYLAIGALEIPVFAEGTMGLEVFMGPTLGYLIGFIFAALLCGWWCSLSINRSFMSILSIMLLAHILILAFGWMWLSTKIGPAEAFNKGVMPFLYGGLIKSLLATLVVKLYFNVRKKRSNQKLGVD
jgi:biotin transport system substrate-specific component